MPADRIIPALAGVLGLVCAGQQGHYIVGGGGWVGITEPYQVIRLAKDFTKLHPSYVNTHFGLQPTEIASVLGGVRVPYVFRVQS